MLKGQRADVAKKRFVVRQVLIFGGWPAQARFWLEWGSSTAGWVAQVRAGFWALTWDKKISL